MKTMALVAALLGSMSALAACVVGTTETDEAMSQSSDDLANPRITYVSVRPDFRRCLAPICGGYFVRNLNDRAREIHVSGLDFTSSGLDGDEIAVALEKVEDLVLYGQMGPADPDYGTRTFQVQTAYRGLPGVTPAASDAFYGVHPRKPPIACLVAPCDNEIATRLNTSSAIEFTSVSVGEAAKPWVDKEWLIGRVEHADALVAGHFTTGQHMPGGYERVLEASQVYLRLPERAGPCPERPQPACADGTMAAYTRTPNRCLSFVSCVEPGVCPQYLPECSEGYQLVSWTSAPSGCPAFACDPSFILSRR